MWGPSCPGEAVICRDDSDTTEESWANTYDASHYAYFITDAYTTGVILSSSQCLFTDFSIANSNLWVSTLKGNSNGVVYGVSIPDGTTVPIGQTATNYAPTHVLHGVHHAQEKLLFAEMIPLPPKNLGEIHLIPHNMLIS